MTYAFHWVEVNRMALQLELPNEFYEELSESLKSIYRDAIEQARADATITKDYLTVPEVRSMLGMVHNTFKAQVENKGIPIIKLGDKRYIKRTDLHMFMENHRIN